MTNQPIIVSATGHRPNKLGGYDFDSKLKLVKFAEKILYDIQPNEVISGGALGWDTAIAIAATNLKIPLMLAIPFREQDIRWSNEDKEIYHKLIEKSHNIIYVDEIDDYECLYVPVGKYHVSKMQNRNRFMVDNSNFLLALWDGSEGGTKNCIDYARNINIPINFIWDSWIEYLGDTSIPILTIPSIPNEADEILAVDVIDEIYQESHADYLSRSTSDDSETDDEETKLLYDDIANDFLGITKVNENGKQEIVYPHQLNPSLPFSPYNAVCNTGKYIYVDEEYLAKNLNWKPNFDFEKCPWEPKRVPDYRQSKRVYLDIETLSLNPNEGEIILIGVMIEGNYDGCSLPKKSIEKLQNGYILEPVCDPVTGRPTRDGEIQMIQSLFRLIETLNPDAICTHNGFDFDFPYISRRAEILGINHPMTRIDKSRRVTAASIYGKPPEFFPVYWSKPNGYGNRIFNDGSFPQLIDTLLLAGQHDKIFANMSAYNLKYLAFYVGFRKEKRLELKGNQIKEYWLSKDPNKKQQVRDYLIFDLEDQRAVTNFFLVSPWYQQMYFPLALQELAVASPARKHNANLENFYKKYYGKSLTMLDGSHKYYQRPEADEKLGYDGALVHCEKGVYKYFFSIDVASLYPSITLVYALMSQSKDPLGVFLKTILTLRSLRYVYKDLGGDVPEKSKSRKAYNDFPYLFADIDMGNIAKEDKKIFKGVDNSLKVGINGGYGFEGVGFYNFNDIASAALVTAYGRIMITKIRNVVETFSDLITLDTDGCKCTPKKLIDLSEETRQLLDKELFYPSGFKKNKVVVEGQKIPYDDGNGFVNPEWIWQAAQSELPEGIVIELEQNCPNGVVYAPKMKNYAFWESPDDKPKLKGTFRKRNRNELQKEFPIEFIRRWGYEGESNAYEYFNEWITKLTGFKVTTKSIFVSHIIQEPSKLKGDERKLNKRLIECGCGVPGDKVAFYWGSYRGLTKSGKKSAAKPFPILRWINGRKLSEHHPLPSDLSPEFLNKQPRLLEYQDKFVIESIPISRKYELNEIIDPELLSKLIFTQRIGKADKRLQMYGMGNVGDNVTFYWASIATTTPSGKPSSKRDRFPVRVIINDDDSLSISLQNIPPDIDQSLIDLNFNLGWYLEDLVKARDEILDVVR